VSLFLLNTIQGHTHPSNIFFLQIITQIIITSINVQVFNKHENKHLTKYFNLSFQSKEFFSLNKHNTYDYLDMTYLN
jgi:hypothetical protein